MRCYEMSETNNWFGEHKKEMVDLKKSLDTDRFMVTEPGDYEFKIDLNSKEKLQMETADGKLLHYIKYIVVDNEKTYVRFTPYQYREFLSVLENKLDSLDKENPILNVKLDIKKVGLTKVAYSFWIEQDK